MEKKELFESVRLIVTEARTKAFRAVNEVLLHMYWQIGKLIVEDEQKGANRAEYGKAVLKNLAKELSKEFGKGFDEPNLRRIRQFYLSFPIRAALRLELSWTHYRIIMRLENQELRDGYVRYAIEGNWNTRVLQRNIDSLYLDRILEIRREQLGPP